MPMEDLFQDSYRHLALESFRDRVSYTVIAIWPVDKIQNITVYAEPLLMLVDIEVIVSLPCHRDLDCAGDTKVGVAGDGLRDV